MQGDLSYQFMNQLSSSLQLNPTQQYLENVPQAMVLWSRDGGLQDQTELAPNPGTTTHQFCDPGMPPDFSGPQCPSLSSQDNRIHLASSQAVEKIK